MKSGRQNGFTLIEVVVTIIISAIAMAAILPFLGQVFLLSHEPRTTLQAELALQSAMESLVGWDASRRNDPALLQSYVSSHGGTYSGQTVVANVFVTFTNGTESFTPSHPHILKVSLASPLTGERVTRLFGVPP